MLDWGSLQGRVCLQLTGLRVEDLAQVADRPAELARRLPVYPAGVVTGWRAGEPLPQPMAGRYVVDGGAVCFLPRFTFLHGHSYTLLVHHSMVGGSAGGFDLDDFEAHTIGRPAHRSEPTTHVVEIRPTAAEIPRNTLRVYVQFSAPMSEGLAGTHVRLRHAVTGEPVDDPFLALEPELWDRQRRRLTVLFDPARIKRGLAPHREAGYPLEVGVPVEIVIDEGFLDAEGEPLTRCGRRRYEIVDDIRTRLDPATWDVFAPSPGTVDPLVVTFDRAVDHALLERCLTLRGCDGHTIAGAVRIPAGEGSWGFWPERPWATEPICLVVDPILEDIAGNSVTRVFDREVARVEPAILAPGRPQSNERQIDLVVEVG